MVAMWMRRALLGVAVAGLVSTRRSSGKRGTVTRMTPGAVTQPPRTAQRRSAATCHHRIDSQVIFPTARRDGWVRRGVLGPECVLSDLESDREVWD